MNALMLVGTWLKRVLLLAIALVCVLAVLWGILYKIFLPFTPLWLDEITIIAVPLAILVTWLIAKAAVRPAAGDERDWRPAEAVPDAAAQLAPDVTPSLPFD